MLPPGEGYRLAHQDLKEALTSAPATMLTSMWNGNLGGGNFFAVSFTFKLFSPYILVTFRFPFSFSLCNSTVRGTFDPVILSRNSWDIWTFSVHYLGFWCHFKNSISESALVCMCVWCLASAQREAWRAKAGNRKHKVSANAVLIHLCIHSSSTRVSVPFPFLANCRTPTESENGTYPFILWPQFFSSSSCLFVFPEF